MLIDQLLVHLRDFFLTYWCILNSFGFATDDKGFMLKM